MHQLVVDSLDFPKESKIKILDLRIGTGETALRILEKIPNAQIDGYDISKNMIKQARKRLKNHLSRVRFFEQDISKSNFTKEYDAIVAVLSIHHLNSKEKQKLFSRLFNSLKKAGFFVIADIVKFDSEKKTKEKEQEWKEFLIKNLGKKEGSFWYENYKEEDLPDSTNNQLKWLENSGFKETKCLFEYMNYAVLYCRK